MSCADARTSWTKWAPLVIFAPLQAALLFYRLDLLPVWGDEYFTLQRSTQSVADMLRDLQLDVHPPLYYLLIRYWVSLPWPGSPIVQIRALSVIYALLALVVMERLWIRHLDQASRWWFYALWTFSPCLLLYARMARSYSMQLLVGCIGMHLAWKFIWTPERRRCLLAYVLGATVLLYTHYLPGIALVAAVTLLLGWRGLRERTSASLAPVICANVLIAIAYAPWLRVLGATIVRVAGGEPYWLVKSVILENLVKLAYWFASFAFGETLQPWGIGLGILLAPGVLFLLWRAAGQAPGWLALLLATTAIGYIGVVQRSSFAFIPSRLLFLLPFFLLLLVLGRRTHQSIGTIVCAGVLFVSLGSIHSYFQKDGFLNKAYVIPFDEIAAYITAHSRADEASVVLDEYGTDAKPMLPELPRSMNVILLRDNAAAQQVRQLVSRPSGGTIWLVRNAHDISPGGLNVAVEAQLAESYDVRRNLFLPYSPLDQVMMRLLGWQERPSHVIELLEMHRRALAQ